MPIHFSCPLCGKLTVVSDQYAGQTGPCAACGGTITIPPAMTSTSGTAPVSGASGGSTLFVILTVLGMIVFVCCGGLGVLFFVGRSQLQVAANRNMAANNLKQIGLALHNYHVVYGTLPPAVVADADGKPLYSGRVLLLPFLEQEPLYRAFDKSKAWDAPENFSISHSGVLQFQDPASAGSSCRADFVFVTGRGTAFEGVKAVPFARITDGLSQTIAVVETSAGPDSWAAPDDWDVDSGSFPAASNPSRGHLTLFLDGSVQSLKPDYAARNLRTLVEIGDGNPLPPQP